MKKTTSYLIAVSACFGELILYELIGVLLGWKNNGGVLPMMMLFGLMAFTWKGIVGLSKPKEDKEEIESKTENNNST